jgi:hypothetical protein
MRHQVAILNWERARTEALVGIYEQLVLLTDAVREWSGLDESEGE